LDRDSHIRRVATGIYTQDGTTNRPDEERARVFLATDTGVVKASKHFVGRGTRDSVTYEWNDFAFTTLPKQTGWVEIGKMHNHPADDVGAILESRINGIPTSCSSGDLIASVRSAQIFGWPLSGMVGPMGMTFLIATQDTLKVSDVDIDIYHRIYGSAGPIAETASELATQLNEWGIVMYTARFDPTKRADSKNPLRRARPIFLKRWPSF